MYIKEEFKLSKWQKIAVILVILSFFGVYRQKFANVLKANAAPILTADEIGQLQLEVDEIYSQAEQSIKDGTYQPIDCARHMYRLDEVSVYGRSCLRLVEKTKMYRDYLCNDYITPNSRVSPTRLNTEDELYAKEEFRKKITAAHHEVRYGAADKGLVHNTDWNRIFALFWSVYLKFLPFVILVLLVKRWPVRKFWLNSFGDVVCLLLSIIFGVIGASIYKPKNFFQQKLDYQLQLWKKKIGKKGWRLVLAYLTAFTVSIFSTLKPVLAKAHKYNTQIVCVTDVPETLEECLLLGDQEGLIGKRENFFEKVFRLLKRILFGSFCLVFVKVNLVSIRKLLWYLIRPIRAGLLEMFCIINPINAPPVYVLVNSHHTRTLKLGGYYERQNINWINTLYNF